MYFLHGESLPSVSRLIEEHYPPFNTEAILPLSAKKQGISVKDLRDKWQRTNIDACELGHTTHDFLEIYDGSQTPQLPQQIAGIKFFKHILVEYEIVCREIRMYSRKFKYAGTADLLLRHKKTGKLVLADYKTNKDLWKSYNNMFYPFHYLESSPYNHYQLQLSYYQMMLEEQGFEIDNRILAYLQSDEEFEIFELVSFTDDLIEHMESKKVELLW